MTLYVYVLSTGVDSGRWSPGWECRGRQSKVLGRDTGLGCYLYK